MSGGRWLAGMVVGVSLAAAVRAQETFSRYEAQYGKPVDVSIADLAQSAGGYEGRAVRTTGRLDFVSSGTQRRYMLRDHFANAILIVPVSDVAYNFESEAMQLMGAEVQVVGVFGRLNASVEAGSEPSGVIQFWRYLGPPEKEPTGPIKATSVSLEDLVLQPGKRDGQTIRVVGKFRGRNLYGDLPATSEKDADDWVVKDDLYAVWVSGKKPKGPGWQLDPALKRDTGKWIEVIGRPETRGSVTYLRAIRVSLTTAPTPVADAQAPAPPPEKPQQPPVVVFALPLDGDREVATNSVFVVQFSKDMDETTFQGHVMLRYRGPRQPGDRDFVGLKLSYDAGRRALTVDPGDVLRSGRQIELMLLPGIADVDGLPLTSRLGRMAGDAVDVLRYQIGS